MELKYDLATPAFSASSEIDMFFSWRNCLIFSPITATHPLSTWIISHMGVVFYKWYISFMMPFGFHSSVHTSLGSFRSTLLLYPDVPHAGRRRKHKHPTDPFHASVQSLPLAQAVR